MMTGKVLRIPVKDNKEMSFAFIKGDDGTEYFLHKSDLIDNWDEVKESVKTLGEVTISYEFTESEKGLRAVAAKVVHQKHGKSGNR
jgi:cold shock CspA family protein